MPVEIPPIISVDDHVIEPPDVWTTFLPSRHQASGPRVERRSYQRVDPGHPLLHRSLQHFPYIPAPSGPTTDFWMYEDLAVPVGNSGMASAGLAPDEIDLSPFGYEKMRTGFYDPKARLADMDVNHTERSLCFPSYPRFCGQRFLEAKDRDLASACVRAYNDWMVDVWCGDSGGRLIPLCLVPLWDAAEAAAEIRRNAARGVTAVAFCELPASLGLPSIHDRQRYWDPFFGACDDTGTVICMHIGSSSKFMKTSDDAPESVLLTTLVANSMMSLADWLLSGVLARFPGLKLAYSESQVGWMPYLFGRVDGIWRKQNRFVGIPEGMDRPPSSYFRGRIYGCVFEDDFGLKARYDVGLDQITFETDYPHQDTTWPHTKQYAERVMADLDATEIHKIVRGNAIRMLNLPAEIHSTVAATN